MCNKCNHKAHEGKTCNTWAMYFRGPTSPPGNGYCICGFDWKSLQDQQFKLNKNNNADNNEVTYK